MWGRGSELGQRAGRLGMMLLAGRGAGIARKDRTCRLPFKISREIRWVLTLSLALGLLLGGPGLRTVTAAQPLQQQRADAQQAFAEAKRLEAQGTQESLRGAIRKYEEALRLWQTSGDARAEGITLNNIGLIYNSLGERAKAVGYFNQALLRLREVKDRREEANTLYNLGGVHVSSREPSKAVSYYDRARQIFHAAGDRSGEAAALCGLGAAHLSAHQAEKSLDYFNQALPLWQATGEHRDEAITFANLGTAYALLHNQEEALRSYGQALRLWREINDRRREALTVYYIGRVYSLSGNHEGALDHYQQALMLWQALGDRAWETAILKFIAGAYEAMGEEQQAIDYYHQAFQLSLAAKNTAGKAGTMPAPDQPTQPTLPFGKKLEELNLFEQALQQAKAGKDQRAELQALSRIGWLYHSLGQQKEALDYSSQALAVAQAVKDQHQQVVVLNHLGLICLHSGEKTNALDYLTQALDLVKRLGDRVEQFNILLNIGLAYDYLDNQMEAVKYYKQALPLAQAARNSRLEVRALTYIGRAYNQRGDTEKALECYKRAASLQQDLGDRQGEAGTLFTISEIYSLAGEPRKADDYQERALKVTRSLKVPALEIGALTKIAEFWHTLGDDQKALDYYNQALQLSQIHRIRGREAHSLMGVGLMYYGLGEYQKALDYQYRALALERETGRSERSVFSYLGLIYTALGEYQKALYYLNQAGRWDYNLLRIGKAYHEMGEYSKALDYYQQALSLASPERGPRLKGYIHSFIGRAYAALGEKGKALEYLNQALTYSRLAGDHDAETATLCDLAQIYDDLGDRRKALDYYQQALTIARTWDKHSWKANSLYGIARVQRHSGNLTEARASIEEALRINESLRTTVIIPELRTSFLAAMQSCYAFYTDLLMEFHRQHPSEGWAAAAFQASERGRARTLLEALTEARADIRQGIAPSLLDRERSLQERLNAKARSQMALLSGKDTEEQVASIRKEIEALTIELQQVQAQIRQTSPRYAALTQPQPLTPTEIQQHVLDADTLLLEYALGEERSYLWSVTPTAITSYDLPNRAEVEAAAQRVYEMLSAPSQNVKGETTEQRDLRLGRAKGQYLAAASSLSQMLLGPVASQLGKKRVVIIADGVLHYIPFGALPDPNRRTEGNESWQPLIVEHEVVNLPSASTLAVLRREVAGRKPAAKTVAVLADPVFAKDDERIKPRARQAEQQTAQPTPEPGSERILKQLAQTAASTPGELRIPRLPFTRQEAEQILALAPVGTGMKALDFAASRATVMSDRLSQYRYVHFATHGLADSERPELSTILLSLFDEQGVPQDGFLRAHEIYNLNLPAELVVLSACETGLGKQVKGEGLVSLTRGFMYAGASRVVVSLWSVSDKATAELMTKFYRKVLVEGERPAAALRAAQIEMWREPQWQAPYYWAAFTLQGEWR